MSFEFSTSIWGINLKRTMYFTYVSFCKNVVNKVFEKASYLLKVDYMML
jgi:hypothetical protein